MTLTKTMLVVMSTTSCTVTLLGGVKETRATVPGCEVNEFAKLTASDASANEEFGRAVGIDGNVAVVGVRLDSVGATWTGSVYVSSLSYSGRSTARS